VCKLPASLRGCLLTRSLSGRIWILAFSAVIETSPDGRFECRWYLSLELGDHSPPTTVNANLVILGSSDATEEDLDDTRTIYFGHPMSGLSPGRDKAIKIRLDDGPIGSHLLNEFVETMCSRLLPLNRSVLPPGRPYSSIRIRLFAQG